MQNLGLKSHILKNLQPNVKFWAPIIFSVENVPCTFLTDDAVASN